MGIDAEWEKVRLFHEKFGHPSPEKPAALLKERAKQRYDWMIEELNEFLESEDIIDRSDAMIDLIYFALGTMVEMGVRPEKLFGIVHNANMAKLWDDGMPRYKNGKVIKPDNWEDPREKLKAAIEKEQG